MLCILPDNSYRIFNFLIISFFTETSYQYTLFLRRRFGFSLSLTKSIPRAIFLFLINPIFVIETILFQRIIITYLMKILTTKFNTKYDTAPFSKIKKGISFIRRNSISKSRNWFSRKRRGTHFQNTIEALDFSGTLDRLSSIFFNLNSAETNDEIQKIAQEVSPLLSDFGNDIRLNIIY
jgi:hypothetical protein